MSDFNNEVWSGVHGTMYAKLQLHIDGPTRWEQRLQVDTHLHYMANELSMKVWREVRGQYGNLIQSQIGEDIE